MAPPNVNLEQRVAHLERSLRSARTIALVALLPSAVLLGGAVTGPSSKSADELRTARLVVVDDKGRTRAVIGEDAANVGRLSRAAGLTLYDTTGAERGGFSTLADGSVVVGLDAPAGVGAPMRDRIGLKVFSNGASYVMLIDNKTRAVARLISEEGTDGSRGVQVFRWEADGSRYYIRTIGADGDARDSVVRR